MMVRRAQKNQAAASGLFSQHQFLQSLPLCVMGVGGDPDGMGDTSILRSVCLKPKAYSRLFGMLNGQGVDLKALQCVCDQIVRRTLSAETTSSGRVIFIADGTDIAKSGRKISYVYFLHDHSGGKRLPHLYVGHSI